MGFGYAKEVADRLFDAGLENIPLLEAFAIGFDGLQIDGALGLVKRKPNCGRAIPYCLGKGFKTPLPIVIFPIDMVRG